MTHKSVARQRTDTLAEFILEQWLPADWDHSEWEAALEDWQEEMFAGITDRFYTWKNEREQQRAEALVEATR